MCPASTWHRNVTTGRSARPMLKWPHFQIVTAGFGIVSKVKCQTAAAIFSRPLEKQAPGCYTPIIGHAVLATCSSSALVPGFGRKQTSESSVASAALETKSIHAINPAKQAQTSSDNAMCSLLEAAHVMTRPSVRSEPLSFMPTRHSLRGTVAAPRP